MLLATLRSSLLRNMLAGKDIHTGDGVIWADEGTIRAGKYF